MCLGITRKLLTWQLANQSKLFLPLNISSFSSFSSCSCHPICCPNICAILTCAWHLFYSTEVGENWQNRSFDWEEYLKKTGAKKTPPFLFRHVTTLFLWCTKALFTLHQVHFSDKTPSQHLKS